MGNATSGYVVSTSKWPSRALDEGKVVAVYTEGVNLAQQAESYAKTEVLGSGVDVYVYQVEVTQIKGYRIRKEVDAFEPTE